MESTIQQIKKLFRYSKDLSLLLLIPFMKVSLQQTACFQAVTSFSLKMLKWILEALEIIQLGPRVSIGSMDTIFKWNQIA